MFWNLLLFFLVASMHKNSVYSSDSIKPPPHRPTCASTTILCIPNSICTDRYDGCQSTCSDPSASNCTRIPVQQRKVACICQPGYLFDKINTKCVKPCDCPCNAATQCKENEEYVKCKTFCPNKCSDPTACYCKPMPIPCIPGCQCKKGFLLDDKTKKCVAPRDCTKSSFCHTVKCGMYQECVECMESPKRTCSSGVTPPPIKRPCQCKPGCQCIPGAIYDDNLGRCVKLGTCSSPPTTAPPCTGVKCGPNSTYSACPPPCRLTCENSKPHQCTHLPGCQPRCECNRGFVWHQATQRCICPSECPKK